MIQIIETGTKKISKCPECGCKFSFEAEDVKENYPKDIDKKKFYKNISFFHKKCYNLFTIFFL